MRMKSQVRSLGKQISGGGVFQAEGTAGAKPWRQGCQLVYSGDISDTREEQGMRSRDDGSQGTQGLVGHCRNLGFCSVC